MAPSRWSRSLRRVSSAAATVGIFLAAALLGTWPLAGNLASAVPLGTERVPTVPLFNLWELWWNADRAAHFFAGYWDAPIFFPAFGTFTYSEPQPLTGLIVAPLWHLSLTPALIYNIALLTILTLNGVFAYRLARALGAHRLPAVLGGILTVSLPFVAMVVGVLHNTTVFGMAWTLEGLVRFGRTGARRWSVWAGLGFVVTYLTMQQHALFLAPFALAAGVLALREQQYRMRPLSALLLAGALTTLVILTLALPAILIHAEAGFVRPEVVVQALSAQPTDFLQRPSTALVPLPPPASRENGGLFPGVLLGLLAMVGLLGAVRQVDQRGWCIYLAGTALCASLLALGLRFEIGGWYPFATLRAIVPGLAEVRAPFRFAIIAQLAAAMLAVMGLAYLQSLLPPKRTWLLVVLGLLAAAENLAVPAPLTRLPTTPRTPWSAWLHAQPDSTVLAHVPFPAGLEVEDYEIEAWRMFAQIDHQKRMVNGYSGYFPRIRAADGTSVPVYTQFQLTMAQHFPDQSLLCTLQKDLGVTMLVVDNQWLDQHTEQMDAQRAFLRQVYTDSQVHVYFLEIPAGVCQPSAAQAQP